ncbi:rhodanese-like domain-containing protein [Pukyongiella litopenaei]|uniref:Rhodanese-like domain-containing protein n=1 Tax=Pukyongiella litopenaei TaxID=2605946 RepID=A0A2S0MRX2_9RHOB|nr:rhodanese-like domain-containing protein [Pukyongiella litopenaei]AVO38606.1 rhodanese-like domain-containing protein [Pukyongiella litopenaei]
MPVPADTRLLIAPTTRRAVILAGAAALAGFGWQALAPDRPPAPPSIDPQAAHQRALAGDLLLVDIRRPDEWRATGIGAGARPVDMRRADFIETLTGLAGGDSARPVALICARGVRSARLARRLKAEGFTRVLDVSEGMAGSAAGPGWLARGLPVAPPTGAGNP